MRQSFQFITSSRRSIVTRLYKLNARASSNTSKWQIVSDRVPARCHFSPFIRSTWNFLIVKSTHSLLIKHTNMPELYTERVPSRSYPILNKSTFSCQISNHCITICISQNSPTIPSIMRYARLMCRRFCRWHDQVRIVPTCYHTSPDHRIWMIVYL